jgi:hypothetical protein
MAEQPQRYCTNCGHELRPEDQFCPNCGTPVHRAAQVPTPGADRPVPPPPQPGAPGAAPQAPPQEQEGRRRPLLLGCLAIFLLLVLAAIVLAGGGGGGGGGDQQKRQGQQAQQQPQQPQPQQEPQQEPRPAPKYKVGQTAKVGNVEWTLTDAYLSDQLRSGFGTQKSGRFVVVDFTFTNNRDEEVTLDPELHMVLKDSQGREFGPDPDAWEFVPTNLNIFLEPVNPGVSQDGRVIYQVAPDAKGFTLTVDDVEFARDESAVFDLSNIAPRAYDTASPAATATATALQ